MITKVPHYYKEFKCIASECTDTCCAGWEIIIDEETFDKYKKVTSPFAERLHSKITIYEDGEPGFALESNANCPFLNNKNLCDIYSELGEDHLCYTCQQFPRFTNEYGSTREIGISMSCPEAARIMLKDDTKVTFESSEDEKLVSTYNDINVNLYIQLLGCRKITLEIMQNRDIELEHRISLILSFAHDIQEKIDEDALNEITDIKKKYANSDFQSDYIKSLPHYKLNKDDELKLLIDYKNTFLNIDHLTEGWPLLIEQSFIESILNNYSTKYHEFKTYYKEKEYEFEHLIVYFIFRYFMEAAIDYDLYAKIKLAAVSFIIIKELDIARYINNGEFTTEDNIDIMHLYSKEIEHSDDNMEALAEIFNTEEIFSLRPLLSLINL